MKKPELKEIPMKSIFDTPAVIVTMGPNQWDTFLQCAYDFGHCLLEVDHNEIPVKAYRKEGIGA